MLNIQKNPTKQTNLLFIRIKYNLLPEEAKSLVELNQKL